MDVSVTTHSKVILVRSVTGIVRVEELQKVPVMLVIVKIHGLDQIVKIVQEEMFIVGLKLNLEITLIKLLVNVIVLVGGLVINVKHVPTIAVVKEEEHQKQLVMDVTVTLTTMVKIVVVAEEPTHPVSTVTPLNHHVLVYVSLIGQKI